MRSEYKAKSTYTVRGMADDNGQPFSLSTINRWDKWTPEELAVLADGSLTDYQKAKLLPNRKDAAVRIKRRRMGFESREVIFHKQFVKLGYTYIRKNGRYERRCRVVAEESIGRELRPEEVVHHINGEKSDDRPENLYVCSNRDEHNKLHYETMVIIKQLMEENRIRFEEGRYILC